MLPQLDFPKWILSVLVTVAVVGLIPIACIAKARNVPSEIPRIHLIQDMDNQGRFKTQQANPIFADGRAGRPPVPGTVPHSTDPVQRAMLIGANEAMRTGLVGDGYATEFPMPLDKTILDRGKRQFDIYCSVCHGLSGYGDGMVSQRALALQQGNWVQPASLHEDPYNAREVGHYFNTITNGIRTMPAYGRQISIQDRWAIVAYMKALQLSQSAELASVPASQRDQIQPALID